MGFGKGEAIVDYSNLALGLLNLFQGRNEKQPATSTGAGKIAKGSVEVMVDTLAAALKSFGIGNYDETGYANLYNELTTEEKSTWTQLMGQFDKDEQKAIQLIVFLMNENREFETVVVPETKNDKGVIITPTETITRYSAKKPGLEFMKDAVRDVNASGVSGANIVADMLRANQLVGNGSTYKRFQESRDKFMATFNAYVILYNRKLEKMSEPVPVNLFMRMMNLLLVGCAENAEPIFQGDGVINAFLRMLGIQTKRSKKCFKNS